MHLTARWLTGPWFISLLLVSFTAGQEPAPQPADSSSGPGPPAGEIAFIRDGNVWLMDVSGANQRLACLVTNATGRLSWSPDNKKIAFSRSGVVDLKGPDLVGGRHKVYDLFLFSCDSAAAGNLKYRERLTYDLGARGPEWTRDGAAIVFWQDMNANQISSRAPNYQISLYDVAEGTVSPLRADWEIDKELFLVTPSMNSEGQIAFVFFSEFQPGGILVLPRSDISIPLDSVRTLAAMNTGFVAPAWSPDGSLLAVVGNYPDDSGLYVFEPDLSNKQLVTLPPPGLQIGKYPPSFSPDSKWLTFCTTDGSIWICDIAGGHLKRLTRPGQDQAPCWSR